MTDGSNVRSGSSAALKRLLECPSGGPASCPPCRERLEAILDAAVKVADAYTAEAEGWNDGEFALWRKDDLVNAIVELRQALGG